MSQIALHEHSKWLVIEECHLFSASHRTIDNYIYLIYDVLNIVMRPKVILLNVNTHFIKKY